VKGIEVTHFHNDCLCGLLAFHQRNISFYASLKTIELCSVNELEKPQNGFDTKVILKVGKRKVISKYIGEGYTKDNNVSCFPSDKVLFGGCLVKALVASKGYPGEANIDEWSTTIQTVKTKYPIVEIVIPGHGITGGSELVDYTIELFQTKQ
jgi:metallo-beta-lactamase class B